MNILSQMYPSHKIAEFPQFPNTIFFRSHTVPHIFNRSTWHGSCVFVKMLWKSHYSKNIYKGSNFAYNYKIAPQSHRRHIRNRKQKSFSKAAERYKSTYLITQPKRNSFISKQQFYHSYETASLLSQSSFNVHTERLHHSHRTISPFPQTSFAILTEQFLHPHKPFSPFLS